MLGQLLEVLAEAVTVRDLSGQIVYANRAALDLLGFRSVEELRGRPTTSIMDDYTVEDEYGVRLGHEDVPSVRVISGDPVSPLLMRVVHRGSGELTWSLLKSSPLREEDGSVAGAITVIEDVTAVKTAELRTRVLAESGRILASSLDYQQTLTNIAEIAVPALAEFCSVDLLDDLGRLRRVAAAHRDPARQIIAERLRGLAPSAGDPVHPATRVIATGTSELFAEVTDAELQNAARDESHLALLREMAIRSILIVPMRVPARTIGVMTLGTVELGPRFGAHDVELAEQLGRRAAVAVENARLHTKLIGVAETVQRSLLPRRLPELPGWEVASLYKPAQTELRVDVGGDFYEFFEHEGTWFAIFGDVGGKGVSAASITALMRHGARVASRSEPQPAAILARLDEALAQQPGDVLCTALCLCVHPDHIVISSAGHPPAILVALDGTLRQAPTAGPLLGAFPGAERPEERIELLPGELLVLYTDGVVEAAGAHDRFGAERLRALLSEHAGSDPRVLLDHLEDRLHDFALAPARDDVAAVALRTRC
jgi:PAS domain S-box-containing protein